MKAVSTLKDFLTDEDLSVPHVCGVLARHFGKCPACGEEHPSRQGDQRFENNITGK